MVVVKLRKDEKGVSQFGLSDADVLATFGQTVVQLDSELGSA